MFSTNVKCHVLKVTKMLKKRKNENKKEYQKQDNVF